MGRQREAAAGARRHSAALSGPRAGPPRSQRTHCTRHSAASAAKWLPLCLACAALKSTALVACGWSHTVAVARERTRRDVGTEIFDADGDRVFSWGAHAHHQLGRPADSPGTPAAIPRFHTGILRVESVACGWKHSLLSTESGEVYSWGAGRSGELGLGDAALVAEHPTLLRSFASDSVLKIRRVLCGWQHSVFHATSGEVFTCGSNRHGQLGTPAASSKVNGVPRVVKAPGGGGGDEGPGELLASHVAVGWHFVLCLAAGTLVSWGKGSHGQLGAACAVASTRSRPALTRVRASCSRRTRPPGVRLGRDISSLPARGWCPSHRMRQRARAGGHERRRAVQLRLGRARQPW